MRPVIDAMKASLLMCMAYREHVEQDIMTGKDDAEPLKAIDEATGKIYRAIDRIYELKRGSDGRI